MIAENFVSVSDLSKIILGCFHGVSTATRLNHKNGPFRESLALFEISQKIDFALFAVHFTTLFTTLLRDAFGQLDRGVR